MNYLNLVFTPVLFFLLISCEKEQTMPDEITPSTEVEFRAPLVAPPNIMYSQTALIVQYGASLTDTDKDDIRTDFQVPNYEVCAHCDGTIEKWDFGPGADIEHKYATAKEKEAEAEGTFMVDREFDFFSDTDAPSLGGGTGSTDYLSKIVAANSGVTIAVLDSGVDANYPSFAGAFLYRDETMTSEIQSGWDYVEEDDNCYDDNLQVHGTAVASIINSYLVNKLIPHQILPIKVAKSDGRVSLFDAYCGISYAAGVADVIQMSFGWYDYGEEEDAFTNDIFASLIEKYEDEVLFVTSAGNSGTNNDVLHHYPSNYDKTNVVAIAAANEMLDDLAGFSNYGASTVDFISLGTAVPFINAEGENVFISGTSFSAPQVAAIAAEHLYLSGLELTPAELLLDLYALGIPIDCMNPTLHDRLLLP